MPFPGSAKQWAAVWFLLILLLGAISWQQWKNGLPLNADLFALLPETEQDPVVRQAQTKAEETFSRIMLVWVSPSTTEDLQASVTRVAETFERTALFSSVLTTLPSLDTQTKAALLPWRYALLAPATRERLKQEDGGRQWIEHFYASLINPMSSSALVPLHEDLFSLTQQWVGELPRQSLTPDAQTGLWLLTIYGKQGAVIILQIKQDAFSLDVPENIAAALADIKQKEKRQNTEILATGAALYAAAASTQAKKEISTVGLGSAIASLALLLIVFRSARAWLTLLPVIVGSWVALLVCGLTFERVHLMTLVFGSSLTGVSIDYALHVMADAFQKEGRWSSRDAVQKLLPGLTLGMITSVLSYGCLALAPFPGLRQVALFSGISLFSAYMTVILTFPLFLTRFQCRHTPLLYKLGEKSLLLRDLLKGRETLLLSGFLIIGVSGLAKITPQDDIRVLYNTPEALKKDEEAFRTSLGAAENSQFFLIKAPDQATLLQREKVLTKQLDELISKQQLASYSALSQWIPSQEEQQENLQQLAAKVFDSNTQIADQLSAMGIDPNVIADEWEAFAQAQKKTLDIDTALSLPIASPWKSLWIGATHDGVASRISLRGGTHLEPLNAIAKNTEGVIFVDRVNDISQLLARYRQYTTALVTLALIATFMLLTLRYKARNALRVISAPALSIIVSVGLMGWMQSPFNLFSLFGFLMVLGMGVDYAIFFQEAGADRLNTTLGISLDALTTLFSFGLLALSQTPAVSAFGLSVLLGIGLSWLFAHFVSSPSTDFSKE